MIQVKMVSYEELPEEVKEFEIHLPNKGHGKEKATYLLVYHDNILIRYESDAMELKDAVFHRDLAWIDDVIVEAYNLGKMDS